MKLEREMKIVKKEKKFNKQNGRMNRGFLVLNNVVLYVQRNKARKKCHITFFAKQKKMLS